MTDVNAGNEVPEFRAEFCKQASFGNSLPRAGLAAGVLDQGVDEVVVICKFAVYLFAALGTAERDCNVASGSERRMRWSSGVPDVGACLVLSRRAGQPFQRRFGWGATSSHGVPYEK